jgi:UDP-2-acetamido-2,6-beta-L-arabino-hexul-4-ose reductase
MRVRVEEINGHRDLRGCVFEPLEGERLASQRNVHVVLSEPGQVRGNHYHRVGTEVLVVMGPALVRTREEGLVRDYEVEEGGLRRFVIPPGIPHAIQHTGSGRGLLVGFNTEGHDPGCPDTFHEALIEVSP